MKRIFVLFLTISAGVSPVWANLGDGGDRIDDLYGNLVERHLVDDGKVSTLYHKDRYLYFVVFDNGVSVGGAKWTPGSASKEGREFKRTDHKAEATYGKVDDRPTLTVRELSTKGAIKN